MTDKKKIFEKTKKMLLENMIEGKAKGLNIRFHYTRPSPTRYPFQYFWDTCFHAFIFTALGENEMAKKHLLSLFALQKEDGFTGHMIYWQRLRVGRLTDIFQSRPRFRNLYQSHMSSLLQPPLAAQAVERIYKNTGDRAFLAQMLSKLKKYYRWISENRDFDRDGLITLISPFESGMDWKPTYDLALGLKERKANWQLFLKVVMVDIKNFLHDYNLKTIHKKGYFLVKDVGFNTIYVQNLHAMARLCRIMQDPAEKGFSSLAAKVTESMIALMYDEKDAAFYDVFGRDNKKIKVLTPTILYPAIIKDMPIRITEKVMKKHFFNSDEFQTPFKLPSVAKNHPSFYPGESLFLWRGPVWIVNNWFLYQFLHEKGYRDEAEELIDNIKKLIKKSGFREYYNPFTGKGGGAREFTWAGLVADMLQMEEKKERTVIQQ